LQENVGELVVSGLASMYSAFDWSVASGHHEYQRACDLIGGKTQRTIWVTSVRKRRERPNLHLAFILSQTSAG
jgi:hypothetical protein